MKVLGWYVVDTHGYLTPCDDEKQAKVLSDRCNIRAVLASRSPHRAVLLAEIEEADVATETNNP